MRRCGDDVRTNFFEFMRRRGDDVRWLVVPGARKKALAEGRSSVTFNAVSTYPRTLVAAA
jgi:hypothetical protein